MKRSRSSVLARTHARPELRFEDQNLTSFAGLVLLQQLFARLRLFDRLRGCFRHQPVHPIFGHARVVLLLVVHLWLGFRRLRDVRYYRDDPMVQRLLGLRVLPDVATLSRTLASADEVAVHKLRTLVQDLVLDRLRGAGLARLTLDFDGSVLSTGRAAEGSAVGFNKKKKGARSYYPLFCTVAQTGQVFDFLHRPGNVHDSNGAADFVRACIERVRSALPWIVLEVRMDAAFFSDQIVRLLDEEGVEFSISVPFERFAELKGLVEGVRRWRHGHGPWAYRETTWKPKVWARRHRFIFVRQRAKVQEKGPLQLDLFVPVEHEHAYQVIVTNKVISARRVAAFHHGRGSQEGLFAELKSQGQMDYVPVRSRVGNQMWLTASILTHNLNRELHMSAHGPVRRCDPKRAAHWIFPQVESVRRRLLQRAGRLTRPNGNLMLTMQANTAVRDELLHHLHALEAPESARRMQR
jgi:hypothetical protein